MQGSNSLQGSWQRQVFFPLAAILVIAADQLTKLWVRENLSLGQSLPEEGAVRLTYVANQGVAFGIAVYQILPLIFSILLIVAALFLYRRYPFNTRLAGIALGLLVGGCVGNFVDRLRLGYVVDFIDLNLWGSFHWPAFNIADAAIVIGAILLVYLMLHVKKSTHN